MISHSKSLITYKSKSSVSDTLNSGFLIKGQKHEIFKKKFSDLIEKKHVDITSSGTMAFFKILSAIGVSKGDEVLIPNYICPSLLGPINYLKATVILYDNQYNNWLSDIEMIKRKITKKTKVILINHTFGFLFKGIEELRNSISSKIEIIEDCCHALSPSSRIGNSKISKFSLCSFYSFNATKLIATGEGGAISSNDTTFFEKINRIKLGDNLSDLSCSLGIQQLDSYQEMLKKRLEIAKLYNQSFGINNDNVDSIYYRYPILVKDNQIYLVSDEISYRLGVDELISNHVESNECLNSERLLSKIVSVPIYPALDKDQIFFIIQYTKKILDATSG